MGYQIIEIPAIDKLIVAQSSLDMQIGIILWLIDYTKNSFDENTIELDLIKVEYLGAYPAIGIRYLLQNSDDLEFLVVSQCEQAINNAAVGQLLEFMHSNMNRIKEEMAKF